MVESLLLVRTILFKDRRTRVVIMVRRTDLEITCVDSVNFHFAIILPTAF